MKKYKVYTSSIFQWILMTSVIGPNIRTDCIGLVYEPLRPRAQLNLGASWLSGSQQRPGALTSALMRQRKLSNDVMNRMCVTSSQGIQEWLRAADEYFGEGQ